MPKQRNVRTQIIPKAADNAKFWEFRNKTEESAELLLYGDIADSSWWGDEVTPKQFAEDLKDLGAVSEITVRINSGGGDVFAAQAIGNLLEQNSASVTAKIDGLCASAATIIACHCDKVVAAQDGTYMIHPVRMGLFGYCDASELEQYIEALATIRENILSLYVKKTGRDKDEVAEWMDATSWWTGAQAKENGFVDELIDEETIVENRNGMLFVNSINSMIAFNDTPKFVQESLAAAPAAEPFVNTTPAEPGNKTQKEVEDMEIKTVDDLRGAYPDLVGEIEAAAADNAAEAERQRIRDIDEMCLPGSETFANDAKFVNPISASEYAVQAIKNAKQAEEAKRQAYLDNVANDAEASGMDGVESEEAEDNAGTQDDFMDAIKAFGTKN